MYTMKFARLPTGNVQIKKGSILLFFLLSKLAFKPGEGEGRVGHAQWDMSTFLGCHTHILKLSRAWIVQNVSASYFSHLFTNLPYREKKFPLLHNVLLLCQEIKAIIPELWLFSFISLKLKNRCQSSLKGSLNSLSPPFCGPSVDENHQTKCGSQLLFGK